MKNNLVQTIFHITVSVAALSVAAHAQTTLFTYQGKLSDAGAPAGGSYQMQFKLFDELAGGGQIGSTITDMPVTATQGIFTVKLDFGANALSGANRWLEIAIRRNSGESYVTLSPREQIASSPYSVRTLSAATADVATNALNLGGVPADQFVQTNDSRLTDERNPLPGSSNYIQNRTTPQTPSPSNFHITGTGKADILEAATQFNIGSSRVLSVGGTRNAFGGVGAGQSNVFGTDNAFFGFNAGLSNMGNAIGIAGNFNSYVGSRAGETNVLGRFNSFFGAGAGRLNTANNNSIFGAGAGEGSTTGGNNSIFGTSAGGSATTGGDNSFFGMQAGAGFTAFGDPPTPNTGSGNSYFGAQAGTKTSTGNNNSFFGFSAGQGNRGGNENAFFGALAGYNNNIGEQNSFFGFNAGLNNTDGLGNAFFGHSAGRNANGSLNAFFGRNAGMNTITTAGRFNVFIGPDTGLSNTTGFSNTVIGDLADVLGSNSSFQTVIGARAVGNGSNSITLGRSNDTVIVPGGVSVLGTNNYIRSLAVGNTPFIPAATLHVAGTLQTGLLTGGGGDPICRYANSILGFCSSSIRYKSDIVPFGSGLDLINRLRPVAYSWKSDGRPDIGFIAEEVAEIEPRLATHNDKGEIEGLRYDRLTTVLVNAIKQQQLRIDTQQKQIDGLKKLVCAQDPQAEVCKENEQ